MLQIFLSPFWKTKMKCFYHLFKTLRKQWRRKGNPFIHYPDRICHDALKCDLFCCRKWNLCYLWPDHFDVSCHDCNILLALASESFTKRTTTYGEIFCAHCSRITRYPSFISQDFFSFSTFIQDGDNLNM